MDEIKKKKKHIKRNSVEPKSLVMYHNNFHKINISNLSVLENNLLFDIFKRLSNTDEIIFSINELNCMIYSNGRIAKNCVTKEIVEKLYENFFCLNFKIIYPRMIEYIHMFSTMRLNYVDDTHKELVSMSIKVNPDFKYLLQDIKKQFTAFDLIEFKKLTSKYSKTLFRLITQYSYCGKFAIKFDEFKELLGIPESYEFKLINNRILKPSVIELENIINNLNYKVYREKIDGKIIHTSIVFLFDKFQNNAEYINRLNKNIEKQTNILSTLEYKRVVDKAEGKDTTELDKRISNIEQSNDRNIERKAKCSK